MDSHDRGRQIQSAANFDAGSPFSSETFNPTEAGSRADGKGDTSSSRLLHMVAVANRLLSTALGSHAMGVFSLDQPSPGYESAGYGRWRFANDKVNKWNCVFRIRDAKAIKPGEYSFRNFVIVGDLESVTLSLRALQQVDGPRGPS